MAQVEIVSERDDASCWVFQVQILDDHGVLSRHELRLSWADYNLWSADGSDSPARVAEAVVHFLVSHTQPHDLPERFDASLARRKFTDADQRIPRFIRA